MREHINRLLDWFRRDTLDHELSEELHFHRQQLEREAFDSGSDDHQARHVASRRLGNVTNVREDARERWSWPRLEQLQQDLRFALRTLRRSPSYATTVVVTLALGIGANVAMFSVIDQMMYRPMPYLRDASSVNRVYPQSIERGKLRTHGSIGYLQYTDIKQWTTSFSNAAAFTDPPLAVGNGESARERRVGVVSASFFSFFDAPPVLGRYFLPSEDVTPIGAAVVVLSETFWKSEYGGRNVLGEKLQVGNINAEIIGVAPKGLGIANEVDVPVAFVPITTYAGMAGSNDAKTYFNQYYWSFLNMMVRRKPGVTEAQATADLSQAFVKTWTEQSKREPRMSKAEFAKPVATAGALKRWGGPDPALEARTALWVTAIAGIVLLIACANVTNLALARALRRQRETAVRLALGAKRARIVTQSIVESVVLTSIAAGGGLLLAGWGALFIRRMLAPIPGLQTQQFTVDSRMLMLAIAFALVVGIITGFVPALLSQRGDLAPALRSGTRGGAHRTALRATLLVVQGALTVVMLVGAGLFVRSLSAVRAMPMGYEADHVLRVNRIERGPVTNEERTALRKRLLEVAQTLPEVRAASWVSSTPFISNSSTQLFVPGIDSVNTLGDFTYQATTADYFKVMGTRILRGRALTDADRAGAPPVAVVSEDMGKTLWPGRDPIGQCMRTFADTMPCTTIVGIAENMVQRDLTAAHRYHYYLSIDQFTRTHGNGLLLLLRGDPAVQGESVRKQLQRVMPGASYVTVRPLADIVAAEQKSWRMGATLLVLFGGLALIVAAVGLYGVISYNVAQRMHELGVRSALGATPLRILKLVVGQSLRFITIGVSVGIALALVVSRWVQPLLFQQSARDPLIYAAVASVMIVVAIGASASPALLASKADPNRALRVD